MCAHYISFLIDTKMVELGILNILNFHPPAHVIGQMHTNEWHFVRTVGTACGYFPSFSVCSMLICNGFQLKYENVSF